MTTVMFQKEKFNYLINFIKMLRCSLKGLYFFKCWSILLYFKGYTIILVSVLFSQLGSTHIFTTELFVSALNASHS